MLRRRKAQDHTVMPGVYLLADHLDAALALAEDLKAIEIELPALKPGMPMRSIVRNSHDLARSLDRVRALELAMTARLLQARKRAEELKRHESSLRFAIALFVGGTARLEDVVAELGEDARIGFETGHAALGFLRSRGMIAADAAGVEGLTRLSVSEGYAVAGGIPLGALMDMIAQFLDTLELLFDLFGGDSSRVAAGAETASTRANRPFAS